MPTLFKPSRPTIKRERAPTFAFPSLSDRVTINGATGSGKTVAGAWLLSEARFDKQPFIIVNFKREALFRKIQRAVQIGIDDPIPTKPGIYHFEPLATMEKEMEDWLWKVHRAGKTGLFIDEGYLMPENSKAFRAILTTGRSLLIPVYTLSQRPVRLPRFTLSESSFYQLFRLQDKRDVKVVNEFTPENEIWRSENRLPDFHSRWYDVARDTSLTLGPVPKEDRILERFDQRLTPRRRLI
jgi:hypothetical protein